MNPFKHKQIEEFTIADCELYISKYPYGEHLIEVKRFLKKLKKQNASQVKEEIVTDSKKPDIKTNNQSSARATADNTQSQQYVNTYSSGDDWTKFFRIIGTIIVIVIAITMATAIADGYVYTGPPIALVAFWVIRAIWKDS